MDCENGDLISETGDHNITACQLLKESALIAADMMDDYSVSYNGTNESHEEGKVITVCLVTIVFVLIFIIGILGNSVLIFTVARNLGMQNPPNIFLANMALGDLLVILISVPFASTIYLTSTWPFGLVLCKFNAMLQDISIGVSIFTLLILSIDRYTAIVNPFKLHNKKASRGCSRAIQVKIIAVWFVSIIFSIPDGINTTLEEVRNDDNNLTYYACSPYPQQLGSDYAMTLVIGKFVVYFVIPVCLISVVYGLMARQLIFSADLIPTHAQHNSQQLQKQMQTRKSLARLFLLMALLFVLCFLPKHIFLLWFYCDPLAMEKYNITAHVFKLIGHCLAYVNSCINPVTLYFLSKVFRKYFNRYLFRKCCQEDSSHDWGSRLRRTETSLPDMSAISMSEYTLADRLVTADLKSVRSSARSFVC